jgi:glutaredoxin
MLDEVNVKYRVIDIKSNSTAKDFIKNEGHKTVPQLYLGETHLNKKADTRDYTPQELYNIILEANNNSWPWQDSGIEQGI